MEEEKEKSWLDPDGKRYTEEEVFNKIVQSSINEENYTKIIVGTDSNAVKHMYKFVTSLCVWNVGKGGYYFYQSVYQPRKMYKNNHKTRLFDETIKSIELADRIKEKLGITVDEVHADISNENANEFSSDLAKNIQGYIISSGYLAVLKNEEVPFCASHISDRHTK